MSPNATPATVSRDPKSLPPTATVNTPPTTPTTLSTTAHTFHAEIIQIHDDLLKISDLAPSEQTNRLLARLVTLCIAPHDVALSTYFFSIPGTQKLCISLRGICANAEAELENYWAERVLSDSKASDATKTQTALLQFPYYTNYTDLSRLECSLLQAFLLPTTSSLQIAFLGSGPLPLTSLNLHAHFPTARIHNIDRDATALQTSSALVARLGLESCMRHVWGVVGVEQAGRVGVNAEEQIAWDTFDVVFLAALVGMSSGEKLQMLRWLGKRLRRGCLVVARSAWGLRGVLYPVLELREELQEMGLEVLAEVHPWTCVVNSIVILRVK